MKLSNDAINQLEKLVSTAMVAGLKKVIVETNQVRGIDDEQSVAVISTDGVPDLGGKQVGINRLEQLASRMSLVRSAGDLQIDATESSQNPNDFALFDLSSGRTRAQFRCASVESVKGVPKTIKDSLVWELKVERGVLPMINQAASSMKAEVITVASRDGKTVSLECVDTTKDVFSTDLETPAAWVGTGDAPTSFCQKYPAKSLLPLLKEATKTDAAATVKLGEGGILSLNVNGFNFFVVPKASSN